MSEQQDDKQEEKFEFNSAGEVQGYISLEEAGVQAIEYARDNPEFYSSRYQAADLVWEISSSTETEDNYEVRLSFRPAGSPIEQAGLEQLIFDKTGQLRVRQMLRQPRGGGPARIIAMVAVGIVAVAIATVVILFSTGVLPPDSGTVTSPVVVVVSPDESSVLISPQGRVQVDLTPGVVDRPVELSYRPVILAQASDRPAGLIPASPVFDLSVDIESDSPDGTFTFNAPVTLSVKIPSGAEELAGGVASNISIQHFSFIESGWEPLPTSIDFRSSTATTQINSLSLFALTVREPPPGARAVRIGDQRPVQGYAGQGPARLSSPHQLAQGEESLVSLELGLKEPLTVNEIRFVSFETKERQGVDVASTASEPAMRVERHDDVPVYSRMKAELEGKSFRITQLEQPEVSLVDGMARWTWKIMPRQGVTGIHQILISLSANERTYRTLEGSIFVKAVEEQSTATPTEIPVPTDTPMPIPTGAPATTVPTKPAVAPSPTPVPVPTALPVPVATPTPVPFDTPVPAQEWRLEDVLVAGDKVTVLVRILGPGWFNITLDGNPTEETIADASLRADVFRNVPAGRHTVRVFTVGVPGQEEVRNLNVMPPTPTFTPTPTPSGPPTPTPLPRYRIFVNGIPVPPLNSLIQIGSGTITLSQAPKSDGGYKGGTEIVLVASSQPGFVVTWGGVEDENGVFATVKMVADRYVTVSMMPPAPTPEPTRTPFPGEVPTPTPVPTAIPLPTPIPVPTATPVPIGPTPIPPSPIPTYTPQPPGEPTNTPAPTPTLTPTPTPVPTFTLTTSASPSQGGTVSPSGANNYLVNTLVPVTAGPNSGYEFTSWSGDCTGSGSCSVTMDADKTVTSGFQLIPTPTPEPVSGKIVFTSSRDGSKDLYVMNADGANSRRLTDNSADDATASWSRDGTKIAFTSQRDGNEEIYVMNADGTNQVNLTNNVAGDEIPSWSPDGSSIAFGSLRDGNWEIYVMNADGSNQTRITTDPSFDTAPRWSPDGSKIAFMSGRDGNQEIYVMNPDGSSQTRLTNHSAGDDRPAWSPDSLKIAFHTFRDGDSEIYVMYADGSNQINLTNHIASDAHPSWSPDGSHVVFVSNRDGNSEIYVMNFDGSSQTNLTVDSANDSLPNWGP